MRSQIIVSGTALVALALLASVGCGHAAATDVASTTPAEVRPVDPEHVVGPFVQAGTRIPIALDQPIDTEASGIGQPFTAHVTEPVTSSDGRVLIPAGARVDGRVASTGNAARPRLRLKLDTVQTLTGTARLDAVVHHAEHFTYAGSEQMSPVEQPSFADDFIYPYDFMSYGTGASRGPESNMAYEEAYSRAIHIPRGAHIALELTRPILPPGTGVRR